MSNRKFNGRFFVFLLILFAPLSIGAHFLHSYQLQRNAGNLLDRARQAEEQGDTGKALGYYVRYLSFRPGDADARARHGLLVARLARTRADYEQAFLTLEQALRLAPDRADVRRRAADLAMELQRFSDAKVHLDLLLGPEPKDPDLLELIARCEDKAGRPGEAMAHYEKALALDARRVDVYVKLADLYRRSDEPDRASGVMGRMIKANPGSVRALVARARYYRELGLLAPAREDVRSARAQEGGAEDADVLLAAADLSLAEGDDRRARSEFRIGLEKHPKDLRFYLGLASLELRTDRAEATRVLESALPHVPERAGELWALADLFIEARAAAQARKLLERLEQGWVEAAAVDYLRARLLMLDGKYREAAELLERCATAFVDRPELALPTALLAASCYERLGAPDRRLAACRQALQIDRASVPGRLALAEALIATGSVGEALDLYRALVNSSAGEQARLTLVHMLARLSLATPSGDRSALAEARSVLEATPAPAKGSADYRLVDAELLVAEGKLDAARRAVEAGCRQAPGDVRFWVSLAALTAEKDGPQAALAMLDKVGDPPGDRVELRLARADILADRVRAKADALKPLEADAARFAAEERARLFEGLSAAYARAGSTADAERLLREAGRLLPNDLSVRVRLFELAGPKADPDALEPVIDELRRLEGEEGSVWRFAFAYQNVLIARRDKRPDCLVTARNWLADVAKARPGWALVPLLEGEIEEGQGNVEAAIERFQTAIKLGARRPEVVGRTAVLLMSRRRYDDAFQVLEDFREQKGALPAELLRVAAGVSVGRNDPKERALELVVRSAPENSPNFRDHLFRGLAFWSFGVSKKAEEAFRKAVDLAPGESETWVSLVAFLAASGRVADARVEMGNAQSKLPPARSALVLASCHEAVGDRAEAEKIYASQLNERPGDADLLRLTASFYLRSGDAAKAEPLLQSLTDSAAAGAEPALGAWARRSLALTLAAGSDYQRSTRALSLIDRNLRDRPDSAEDQRVRALVLAGRPGGRRQSIRDLEKSFINLRSTPAEDFLLAQLYEADGNWPKANERLVGLLARPGGDNPDYVAYYIRTLLRHEDVNGAAVQLARLEARESEAGKPRTAELKARVWCRQGKKAEAAALLKSFARDSYRKEQNPGILRSIGLLLAELQMPAEAEEMLRQYVGANAPKHPASVATLIDFLARHNRVAEALELAAKALASGVEPEVIGRVCVSAVRVGDPSEAHFAEAERIVQTATRAKPASLDLVVSLADLRDAQGRYEEAKTLYRSVLKIDPRNLLAMNNLAWLLALQQGDTAGALALVDEAIRLAGPTDNLLDTRGVIYLTMGRAEDAAADFAEAIAQSPSGLYYFHRAQAHRRLKNTSEARNDMDKAKELGLRPRDLHALERPEYEKLLAAG